MKPIKKAENMTFTINYSDGEKREIKEGVLFSTEGKRLEIHVGTNRKEVLFAIAEALTEAVIDMGYGAEFEAYILRETKDNKNRKHDKILQSLPQADLSKLKTPIISVYNRRQREYPGKYVARIFDMDQPTNAVILSDSLEELQTHIRMNFHGVFFHRGKDDDPSLIGCWL